MQTQTDTNHETWDGTPVPPERWGKDHMSTLLYIETRNVDGDGQPNRAQMRTANGRPRRGASDKDNPPRMVDHPTVLADGTRLQGHDDWDCVNDMEAAGVIDWQGTGTYPILRLTSIGWALAAAGRRHLAESSARGRRSWEGFCVPVHLPPPVSREEVQRSEAAVAGEPWSAEELQETLRRMDRLCSDFYWACFTAGMGSRCHPFLEFNGIMSKYVNLCSNAAAQGFQFPAANQHSGLALPMQDHDVDYFAEKFACIFGPFFEAHPELADRFADRLVAGKGHR